MKAAVFHKPGDIRYDTVEDPRIEQDTDVILKVTSTAICGSDLHILSGGVPQTHPMVMGHEFMGIVEEVGKGVTRLKKGDRVVVPFPISCGQCFFCQHDASPACEHSNYKHYGPNGDVADQKGAALFGYTDLYGGYSGGQAEYVRVPYADISPRVVPDNMSDEQVLFLTDIFPTGWSAIDWAQLKGGEVVAIFGSGPVGLMAQKAAWLNGASRVIAIDPLNYRLEKAKAVNKVETLNPNEVDVVEAIRSMTGGRGADVCVDAVGFEPERDLLDKAKALFNFEAGSMKVLDMAFKAVRRMGTVTIMGVYGSTYDNFPLHRLFDKGITLKMGQAPVLNYIDHLIDLVKEEKVVLDDIITHTLPLSEVTRGYEIFDKKEEDCVKVVLKPWEQQKPTENTEPVKLKTKMENQKTALITGATSGIGKELAKLFAKDQYNLIIVSRNQAELDNTANELRAIGISVKTIAKDLSDMEQAKALCSEVTERIDVLVNDAGQGVYGLFTDNDLERELGIVHLNICATVILTKHFLKDMVARGEGKILNLGSVAGKLPGPWQAVYHATKAFVLSFTTAVREEVKDSGVTLTALMPGVTDTDFFNKAGMNDSKAVQDKEAMADPADVAKDGYDALMAGDDRVISGLKNKVQVNAANLMPDSAVAHQLYEQQKPVEQE